MKKLVLFIGIIAVAFGVLWMISRPEGERNVSPRMSMEKGSPVVVRAGAEKADVGDGELRLVVSNLAGVKRRELVW